MNERERNSTRAKAPGDETTPGSLQSGEDTCRRCGGTGRVAQEVCSECAGSGTVTVIVGDA